MSKENLNRIKAVLAETGKTNRDLAKLTGKTESTVSRWCTNDIQPSVETFAMIAEFLEVDIRDLFVSSKNNGERK